MLGGTGNNVTRMMFCHDERHQIHQRYVEAIEQQLDLGSR